MNTVEDFLRYFESEEERKKAAEIQQDTQTICQMIYEARFKRLWDQFRNI